MAADGVVYVADTRNSMVRRVEALEGGAVVSTLCGAAGGGSAPGVGSAALMQRPSSVAINWEGHLLVADQGNNVVWEIS